MRFDQLLKRFSPRAAPTRAPIRLVVSDLDGTLINHDRQLTPRTQAAIHALDSAGIRFAITTARPPRGVRMIAPLLRVRLPIACYNGGMIVDPLLSGPDYRDPVVLERHVLNPEVARELVAEIDAAGVDIWLFRGTDWYVRDLEGAHIAREQGAVWFAPERVTSFNNLTDSAVKIVGVSDDADKLAALETRLQARFAGRASASRSQSYYLDITHPDSGKGKVIDRLSSWYSIPREQICTLGDMANDVAMFKRSGLSIAMGNAREDVQKQATHVTLSNNEDGVAEALERWVLPPRAGQGRVA